MQAQWVVLGADFRQALSNPVGDGFPESLRGVHGVRGGVRSVLLVAGYRGGPQVVDVDGPSGVPKEAGDVVQPLAVLQADDGPVVGDRPVFTLPLEDSG